MPQAKPSWREEYRNVKASRGMPGVIALLRLRAKHEAGGRHQNVAAYGVAKKRRKGGEGALS